MRSIDVSSGAAATVVVEGASDVLRVHSWNPHIR